MEGDGEDSSAPHDDTQGNPFYCLSLTGYLCRRFGITGKKLKTYSLLASLFKSEVLYALYVWYIGSLVSAESEELMWRDVKLMKILPYLWMLKPIFALVDDSMDRCLRSLASFWRHIYGGTVSPDKIGIRLGRKRCFLDSVIDMNQRYNIMLMVSEIGILLLVLLLLLGIYFKSIMKNFGFSIFLSLALCQIAASATSEGIFCRYLQCNDELSEVQFISLRQMITAFYGASTLFCIICPFALRFDFIFSIMALFNIYPVFLVSNTVSILWVVLSDDAGYEEAVDMSRRAETSWSPKVTISFVVLLIMAMDLRYRCVLGAYRTYEYPYVVLVATLLTGQLLKLLVGYIFAKRLTLQGLINIARYMFMALFFVSTFAESLVTPPSSGYSDIWMMVTVFMTTTLLQYVLTTFGLALSVRTAPIKFESTMTCLTDFVLDMVAFIYRENLPAREYALRIFKYDAVLDGLVCFFCLYSYFVVFGGPNIEALLHRGITGPKLEQQPRLPKYFPVIEETVPLKNGLEDYQADAPSSVINSQDLLQDLDAEKSPWGAGSDYTDASD